MPRRALSAVLIVLLATAGVTVASSPKRTAPTPGFSRILNAFQADDVVRGIATFEAVPTHGQVRALRRLGVRTQPMKRLPLALVHGPVGALRAGLASGLANDVYADERNELFDTESSDSIGGAALRAKGLTGKGVTVGIVDSGCDATHPDLADHVVHNVKLISAEYLNLPPDSSNTIVVPVEMLPFNDSDPTAGHGTHVAGIIAADGTTGPEHVGVAPDAELVCLAIGEGIFTTAVVTAYDFLLDQEDLWDVDVINNSWGNSFYMFDPRHPMNVASRAMVDAGVVVAFAAGNAGDSNAEMSLNLFSVAPWVISVAAADVERFRGSFSSNGLQYDNARGFSIGAGGHKAFRKHHLGIYHPDVTAPGVNISSSCSHTGVAPGPCTNSSGNVSANGTSMATPHVAGAAAILLQANPGLTPEMVQKALQATARPVYAEVDGEKQELGFWQAGYGFIDLEAAVRLVTSSEWEAGIVDQQRAADGRVLRSFGARVRRTDMWTYDAPRVAFEGLTDTRVFRTTIPLGTTLLKVTLAHPSLYVFQVNGMDYPVTVRDAAGNELGTSTESLLGHGTASILFDLRTLKNVAYGVFEFEVRGMMAISDPDTIDSESALGRVVVLHVAQMTPLRD